MGTQSARHQRLKQGVLLFCLLASACKHRRGPALPEEWTARSADGTRSSLADLASEAKALRFLELYDDGFVTTDSLTYRLDPLQRVLVVERRFDPVPLSGDEPLVILSRISWSAEAQKLFLDKLKTANVRQVPRCNPYAAVDGGYGGRFLTLVDADGREHMFGASDAVCAPSDHDCSGSCIGLTAMEETLQGLAAVLPIPQKPTTVFVGAGKELVVYGEWQAQEPRADVRKALASKLCSLAAFSSEKNADGTWTILSSTREKLGLIRIDSQTRTVTCLSP